MTASANLNIAAVTIGDKVDPGLGPKNPTIGKDRRVALPHAISGISVDTPQGKAKKRDKNSAPAPAIPKEAIRDSRIGGTVALFCAAAISAQTLFALGRLIGLSAWTAWLLPAALDVYAMTATRVAFQVPVSHDARNKAIWNARVALFFTISSNCLYHAMHLAAGHHRWTPADWALVGVSALPPIVVERLLHLQSIVNTGGAPVAVEAETGNWKPSTPTSTSNGAERQPAPEASASATASKPLPKAAPNGSPAVSSRTRPAASTASRHAASGPIPIQRAARLEVVRDWIANTGGDKEAVPLKEIQERFGVSQATASRMRAEAAELPSKPASQSEQGADEEPERALEAV
jgi:hypothetical protein